MANSGSPPYQIKVGHTLRDSLTETGKFLAEEYHRVVDRRRDTAEQPLDDDTERDAHFALLHLYASFVSCLIEITAGQSVPAHEVLHLRPEGRHGLFFYAPATGAAGSMYLFDGSWRIKYDD